MTHREYEKIRARLILRLVRACARAEVIDALDEATDWSNADLLVRVNTDATFRRALLAHPLVVSTLDDADAYTR